MSNHKNNFTKITKLINFFAIILAVFVLYSCSPSYNPNIERGSTYLFRSGHPQVRISAIGLFDQQGKPGVDVTADIVYGSLIYKNLDGEYTANINIQIQVAQQKKDSSLGISRNFDLTIKRENKEIIHSGNVFTFQKRFPMKPGDYNVSVVVTDKSSK
ncbi:MAG TPA: hypothetical protein VKA34_17235, partial [Balneolales bacterium]|nr:hypothetical protein [Balneolales bacterium]